MQRDNTECNTEEKSEFCYNTKILMEHNPLSCDCDFLYNLLRYNKGKIIRKFTHRIQNIDIKLENLICQNPKEMEKVRISDLNSMNLTCKIENTDSINVCPEECNCFLKPYDKTFIFDCSNKNLTSVPSNIKKPNISSIQAYTRSIDSISQFELNFSHNLLMHMPNLETIELRKESIKKLILSYNNISEITSNGLSTTMKVCNILYIFQIII